MSGGRYQRTEPVAPGLLVRVTMTIGHGRRALLRTEALRWRDTYEELEVQMTTERTVPAVRCRQAFAEAVHAVVESRRR